MTEIRLESSAIAKSQSLPSDYLKLVKESLKERFSQLFASLNEINGAPIQLEAFGKIYAEEIVMGICLLKNATLAGTSIYASVDFNWSKSVNRTEEVHEKCSLCLDAVEATVETLYDLEDRPRLQSLLELSLSALEGHKNIPFEWTRINVGPNNLSVHVKIDKSNALLDQLTEDWLGRNDPELKAHEEASEQESKKLFILQKVTR